MPKARNISIVLAALVVAISTTPAPCAGTQAVAKPLLGVQARIAPTLKVPPQSEDSRDGRADRNIDRNDVDRVVDDETGQAHVADRAADEQDHESDLYDEGSEALDDSHFDQAAEVFGRVIALRGEKADGAMYWRAYAENRLGHRDAALKQLAELQNLHPTSRWVKDGKALEVQVRQAGGQSVSPEMQNDEDLKLIAINGLMNSEPARAVPLLEKLLAGNQPPRIKDRALFVLAQHDSPLAREAIARIARGQANPDLQKKALRDLGLFGGSESRNLLAEIYNSSSDVQIKRTILGSFMLAGEHEKLLAAARAEKSPELRAEAVRQLGLLGAENELWQLYQAESAREVKRQIIQAMFIGGGSERLGELARGEKDPELRREAIHSLGLVGGEKAAATLAAIYSSAPDLRDRREVIEALFLQGNAKELVALARNEKDPSLRKAAIEKLSLMGNKEATDFLMEIINK